MRLHPPCFCRRMIGLRRVVGRVLLEHHVRVGIHGHPVAEFKFMQQPRHWTAQQGMLAPRSERHDSRFLAPEPEFADRGFAETIDDSDDVVLPRRPPGSECVAVYAPVGVEPALAPRLHAVTCTRAERVPAARRAVQPRAPAVSVLADQPRICQVGPVGKPRPHTTHHTRRQRRAFGAGEPCLEISLVHAGTGSAGSGTGSAGAGLVAGSSAGASKGSNSMCFNGSPMLPLRISRTLNSRFLIVIALFLWLFLFRLDQDRYGCGLCAVDAQHVMLVADLECGWCVSAHGAQALIHGQPKTRLGAGRVRHASTCAWLPRTASRVAVSTTRDSWPRCGDPWPGMTGRHS